MPEMDANERLAPHIHEELKGLKLLVTDLDLQQTEHRGIAAYSKSLLKALKASGAEAWLLTDLYTNDNQLRRLPKAARNLIQTADILHHLANGKDVAIQQCLSTLKKNQHRKRKKTIHSATTPIATVKVSGSTPVRGRLAKTRLQQPQHNVIQISRMRITLCPTRTHELCAIAQWNHIGQGFVCEREQTGIPAKTQEPRNQAWRIF
jgi:hypothetical protein